jgi:hypothetical protein
MSYGSFLNQSLKKRHPLMSDAPSGLCYNLGERTQSRWVRSSDKNPLSRASAEGGLLCPLSRC